MNNRNRIKRGPFFHKAIGSLALLFSILSNQNIYSQQIIRGPYLQTGTPTSIIVKWRTDDSTTSVVRFGPSLNTLDSAVFDTTRTTEHEVKLINLTADSKYYYSVGTGAAVLAGNDSGYYFITSPLPGQQKPTRIWILGDSGTKNNNARAVRDAYYNFTGDRHTDLWLMLGDNAYGKGSDEDYQLAVFENMYEAMLRTSVLWPTLGNHDDNTASTPGPYPYYDIFTLPTNGEAGGLASGTEEYYSFDYANIHFVCLISATNALRELDSPMWVWLQEDLAGNTADWTIAFWHHPPYSKGKHNSNSDGELIEMREHALPLLEDAGVDLVLGGHSHSYERSFLVDRHYGKSWTLADSMIVDGGNGHIDGDGAYHKQTLGSAPHEGAVFIVAGSSGKIQGGSGFNHPVMVTSLKVLGSLVIDILGNQLDAKFLDKDGVIEDYFTITKGAEPTAPATKLINISGEGQSALAGSPLPQPFVVETRDDSNRVVPGTPVTFEITSGGDSLSNSQPQLTNAEGRAEARLILGATPGITTVAAISEGLSGSPVVFTATAILPAPPEISVTPANQDFGTVVVGDSLTKPLLIANSGETELSITSLQFFGADSAEFELSGSSLPLFMISDKDSANLYVKFVPVSEGSKTAVLRIVSNAANADTVQVRVSGASVQPENIPRFAPTISTTRTTNDADDPAIWIHPANPSRSVIIGTDKTDGIFVWDLNGALLQSITQGSKVNNVDVRQNVSFGGETVDIVAANLRNAGKLAVFTVNPDYTGSDVLTQIADVNSSNNDIQKDSYGFGLYRHEPDSSLYVFERPKRRGEIRQYLISRDSTGSSVLVTSVRDLNYQGGTAEGFVADDMHGFLYVAEEDSGVHKYYAEPDMSPEPIAFFASGDGIRSDREGLGLYSCDDGNGYLILSSQGNSTIKIYERQGDNRFVKTIIGLDEAGNADLGTDGLDVTSYSGAPNLPSGFLVVHDQGGKRFHLYDWAQIAGEELTICFDGRVEIPRPRIKSSTTALDFGEVFLDSSVTRHLYIGNFGDAPLAITEALFVGENASEFALTSGKGPMSIQTGDSVQVALDFTPVSEGEKTVILRFLSNDPDLGQLDVSLFGTGKIQMAVSVDEGQNRHVPKDFALKSNYPNPFNAETTIVYDLPKESEVKLDIYDLLGHRIRNLVNQRETAGTKKVRWNGQDQSGRTVSSGIYYVKMEVDSGSFVRKITLLK
ncbi:MAG: phytase [bacterium]